MNQSDPRGLWPWVNEFGSSWLQRTAQTILVFVFSTPVSAREPTEYEQYMLELINRARSEPLDIDGDNNVFPVDALAIINHLNREGTHRLPIPPIDPNVPPPFLDPDGNRRVEPLDALMVINALNASNIFGSTATSIPGPSGLVLAGLGWSVFLWKWRGRAALV